MAHPWPFKQTAKEEVKPSKVWKWYETIVIINVIFQPQEQLTMLMISLHWAIERSNVDKIELSALNEGLHNSDFKTRKEKKDANNTLA